jgi:hypothetical protein
MNKIVGPILTYGDRASGSMERVGLTLILTAS